MVHDAFDRHASQRREARDVVRVRFAGAVLTAKRRRRNAGLIRNVTQTQVLLLATTAHRTTQLFGIDSVFFTMG
jgi:hypothetical protein